MSTCLRSRLPHRGLAVTIIAIAVALMIAITQAKVQADEPVPAASASPMNAASVAGSDPCGDTNLLATTDRPTFGTNPCVVKPRDAIIEIGYKNTTTTGDARTSEQSSYPENRDRIGLVKNLELVLDVPTDLRSTASGTSINGLSNLGTGLKYEIGHFGTFVHGVAAEAVYPTGDSRFTNGLPSFNGSYQIGGAILPNLGFNLTLGFNSFSTPGDRSGKNVTTTAFAPSFIVGGRVAPETKLNVEVANASSSGPGTSGQYFGNVFLQHQFSSFLLLDVEVAQRLTVVDGSHQHYVGAGAAVKL
jgi:hypothetical protein